MYRIKHKLKKKLQKGGFSKENRIEQNINSEG